jgi:hypothetical protein
MVWGEGIFVFPLVLLYTVIKLQRLSGQNPAQPPTITERGEEGVSQ